MSQYQIDFNDSNKMWQFAMENCKHAHQYAEARKRFGIALKELKVALVKAYKHHEIDRKHSEEKAYLMLADKDKECQAHLMMMIQAEQSYKGLEKIIEARSAALSFNQSLIKNKIAERG